MADAAMSTCLFFQLIENEFYDHVIFKAKQLCDTFVDPWLYCIQVDF